MAKHEDNRLDILLRQFNQRDTLAFGEVYSILHEELFHFASTLYRDTEIVAGDVIHDLFVNLWQNEKQQFDGMINIRAYLYVSIRNGFKNYITHKKHVDNYKNIPNDNQFILQVAESSLLSIVDQALTILPKDCAEVLKYYLDGWQIKEIAIKLEKPERTIYNKKSEAISILRNKISKDKLYFLLTFMGSV